MKIKIVQFDNGRFGVQTKHWLDNNLLWLYSEGYVYKSYAPSVERCFDTIEEAEQAIEKYKQRRIMYKDKGKLIRDVT